MTIEQVRSGACAADAKVAFFDFDGTLSLVRSGWMDVMVPMMVEILADLKSGETEAELKTVVEDFVWRLTGKETGYLPEHMRRLLMRGLSTRRHRHGMTLPRAGGAIADREDVVGGTMRTTRRA